MIPVALAKHRSMGRTSTPAVAGWPRGVWGSPFSTLFKPAKLSPSFDLPVWSWPTSDLAEISALGYQG